jgi:hypothetical protein
MARAGEAVDAAVLAAPIRIHRPVESEVRAFITGNDRLGFLSGHSSLDTGRLVVLGSGPAVVKHLGLKTLEAAGLV